MSTQQTTKIKKPGTYISEITFNNGEKIFIEPNDIVVFVGPNNAGKSQAVKDIYNAAQNKEGIVVHNAKVEINQDGLLETMEQIATIEKQGTYTIYRSMGHMASIIWNTNPDYSERNIKELSPFFSAKLDTVARLTSCNPPANVTRDDVWSSPIHYARFST